MARIIGVDLPNHKRIDIALTLVYGVGRSNVKNILQKANVENGKRVKDVSEEELNKIQKAIEELVKVEGDLRREVQGNIKRLRETGSYRGLRHARGLPSRGQRTRANARTRRGRRITIGALKKEDRIKQQDSAQKK